MSCLATELIQIANEYVTIWILSCAAFPSRY